VGTRRWPFQRADGATHMRIPVGPTLMLVNTIERHQYVGTLDSCHVQNTTCWWCDAHKNTRTLLLVSTIVSPLTHFAFLLIRSGPIDWSSPCGSVFPAKVKSAQQRR
jgi:hypothetical protein